MLNIYVDDFCKDKNIENYISENINADITFQENIDKTTEFLIALPEFVSTINLKDYPKLKFIQIITSGYNLVNLEHLKKYNCILSNAKGCFTIEIAEEVITKILVLNRYVEKQLINQRNHNYKREDIRSEIYSQKVLIAGTGSIGSRIASLLKAFGTTNVGYRKQNSPLPYFDKIVTNLEDFDNELKSSDIVILALPLSEDNKGFFNLDRFKLMKPSSIFINVARGQHVVENDLIYALENKLIYGAGLDVFEVEPLPTDSKLYSLPNCYLTPHQASSSPFQYIRVAELALRNINNFLENKPIENKVV